MKDLHSILAIILILALIFGAMQQMLGPYLALLLHHLEKYIMEIMKFWA